MSVIVRALGRSRASSAPSPVAVIAALARVEAKRAIRNPLIVLSAAAAPLMLLGRTRDLIPLLHTDEALVAESLLPFAFVALVVANTQAFRAHRIPETLGSVPTSPGILVLGHLGALFATVALAALIVVVDLVLLVALGGFGAPDLWELATGPLIVAFAGAAGVALAFRIPWRPAAPIAAIGLSAFGLLTTTREPRSLLRWLGLYAQPADIFEVVPALEARPSAPHVVYLLGLVTVAAASAISLNVRRRLIAIAVAGAILASGVVATAQSLRASENGVDTAFVFAQRSCSQQDATTICLHPGYEGYRPLVMDLVDRFNSGLPKGVPGPTFIVQKLLPYYPHESDESNEPSAAVIGPRWGRGEAAAEYEFGLALQLAVAVVGIPVGEFEFEPSRAMRRYYEREFAHVLPPRETTDRCYAMGEARAVLALWLAARTTPGAEDYLRDQARVYVRPPRVIGEGEHQRVLWCCDIYAPGSREPGARVLFNHRMTPGARELEYAVALLDVAPERVLSLWERWIEPTTSTEQAIRSVGLQSLPTKREILRREGIDHVPLLHDDPGQNEPRCRDVEGG